MPSVYQKSLFISCLCLFTVTCVDGLMNDTLRNMLLTLHNNARDDVRKGAISGQPKAISIKHVKYNMELEKKAQNLSDQCRVGHDTDAERKVPPFTYIGQNWAGAATVELGFNSWLNEYKNYDFYGSYCYNGQCNKYTQIVWQKTTDIGCGVTKCPSAPYGLSIVCNYGPGGRYIDQYPYETDQTGKL
ncbi:unnamed protein product [Trichobilharzia szidati]|nr:unnamed protein product [Trichobilharzia szidati]